MSFRISLLVLLVVLTLDITAISVGWYGVFPWLDIPLHVFGGFGVGLFAIALRDVGIPPAVRKKIPWWMHVLFVVGIGMLVGVMWEWHEWMTDVLFSPARDMSRMQLSLTDTMKDLFNDFLGAVLAFLCAGRVTRVKGKK